MIGIIGAMQSEVELLVASLEDAKSETVSGIEFFKGRLSGVDVVIAKCGIGKVFAAICAQTMIIKYRVSMLINTGVGGAISNELDICDVVVSDYVVQHDMDTSALGDPVGLISGINVVKIAADEKAAVCIMKRAESLGIKCVRGTVASGDQFVCDVDKKNYIESVFGASVCEMEGAAIGQVCYVNNVPFCVMRAISDKADGSSSMDYMTFVSIAAKKNAALLIESLPFLPYFS